MEATRKRLLIVEEALKDYEGHWYEYDKAVADIHRRAGVETVVAAHRDVRAGLADGLDVRPVFPCTSWDMIYYHPNPWRRYAGVLQHNRIFYRNLSGFLDTNGFFDVVFVPAVSIHHLAALAWLARSCRERFGRLVLFLRNNVGSYDKGDSIPRFKRSDAFWRLLLRALHGPARRGRVVLATDSARLADQYALLGGIRPAVFPSPRIAPLPAAFRERAAGAPVVMAGLGPARHEKGSDILLEAIRRVRARRPDLPVRFVVQWPREVGMPDGSCLMPDETLARDPCVEFLGANLSSAVYAQRLASCDCMLLPYRSAAYYARISGPAVEAATGGIPMLYTRGTWIDGMAAEYGAGLAVEQDDPEDLAHKIILMAEHIDTFRQLAWDRMPKARAVHAPERFMECLWSAQSRLWGRPLPALR